MWSIRLYSAVLPCELAEQFSVKTAVVFCETPCAQNGATKGTFLSTELHVPVPELPEQAFLPALRWN